MSLRSHAPANVQLPKARGERQGRVGAAPAPFARHHPGAARHAGAARRLGPVAPCCAAIHGSHAVASHRECTTSHISRGGLWLEPPAPRFDCRRGLDTACMEHRDVLVMPWACMGHSGATYAAVGSWSHARVWPLRLVGPEHVAVLTQPAGNRSNTAGPCCHKGRRIHCSQAERPTSEPPVHWRALARGLPAGSGREGSSRPAPAVPDNERAALSLSILTESCAAEGGGNFLERMAARSG